MIKTHNVAFILSGIQKMINFILPLTCPLCRECVGGKRTLCADCWRSVSFISAPFCEQCSYPFAVGEYGEEIYCGSCLKTPPYFSKTRAVFKYDDFSKNLILPFKHNKALHIGVILADWMGKAGQSIIEDADLLIPVPLHWTRLLRRGFNQAAILSEKMAAKYEKQHRTDILKRNHRTPSQGKLTVVARQKNVKGAFSVPQDRKCLIQNKKIILIDDVMTTGATVNACAGALLCAGAREVNVLVAARV